MNVYVVVAGILLKDARADSVSNTHRSSVEPFGHHCWTTATTGWNAAVIGVRDEYVSTSRRTATLRENRDLCGEVRCGAASTREDHSVSAAIGRGNILEDGVPAVKAEARIEERNESQQDESQLSLRSSVDDV